MLLCVHIINEIVSYQNGEKYYEKFVILLKIYLLISGSSREFAGFNTEMNEFIVARIWERASEFFPTMKEISFSDIKSSSKVRIGLRPYSEYHVTYNKF